MIDGFGRRITYVRMSVTDRCDLRCRYCMAERMTFLPRKDVLSLEEIVELADIFIARGVNRIRLTGGEPLVRRSIDQLIPELGKRVGNGLDELTMTTNGTQLERHAPMLAEAGIRRINVSLDSRDSDRFWHITRRGDLNQVLRVHRKRVADERAAARPERKSLEPIVLRDVVLNPEDINARKWRRRADREPADLLCGREIPFEECRRHLQDAGHVVEPVARIIGWQHRGDVDVYPE